MAAPSRPSTALLALGAFLFLTATARAEESTREDADPTAVLRHEATEYDDAGRYVEAARAWEKVLAERPNDHEAELALATSLRGIATRESLRRAEAILVPLTKLDWEHPTRGNVRFEVDHTLATVLASLSEHVEDGAERTRLLRRAIEAWERVLADSARHPPALLGIAQAKFSLDLDEEGIPYAERYLHLCTESRRRWQDQQVRWLAQMGSAATPAQAEFFDAKIAASRRQEEKVLHLLGAAHLRRNEAKKAQARYDAVLLLVPDSCAALLGRARVHVALGELEIAVEDLERCLDVADDDTPRDVRRSAAELLERCRGALTERAPPR